MPVFGSGQLIVVALGLLACWCDVRARRIPNALTLGGASMAMIAGAVNGGSTGLSHSVFGWLTGCALFLPFFLLRGMGAGDVKLIACVGAWLGPAAALWTALYAAIAGGLMAVAVALSSGYLRQAIVNVQLLFYFWKTEGIKPLPALTLAEGRGPRLPYALPIVAGALTVMWWQ